MKFYQPWQGASALSFDLDDTLYDNHQVIKNAEQKLQSWLVDKMPAIADFTSQDWQAIEQTLSKNAQLQSHVTEKRRARLFLAAMQCNLTQEKAKQVADEALAFFLFERSNFSVPQSVFELLEKLSAKYPLVAITNGNVNCDSLGLSPFFNHVLKAGFDGQAKPHEQMFRCAEKRLAIPANKILHVGDHLTTDVAGAKAAGFQACWLNNTQIAFEQQACATVAPDVELENIQQLSFLLTN